MSRLDWKALQARVVRALCLSLFTAVVTYCGSAFASEYGNEQTDLTITLEDPESNALIETMLTRSPQLAETRLLSSVLHAELDIGANFDLAKAESAAAESVAEEAQPIEEISESDRPDPVDIIITKPSVSFDGQLPASETETESEKDQKAELHFRLVAPKQAVAEVSGSADFSEAGEIALKSEASERKESESAAPEGEESENAAPENAAPESEESENAAPEGEESEDEESEREEQNRTDAEKLKIPTRFGAGYHTSDSGFDDIISVGAFVPITQTAGEDVTFFEGNLQLSDGNPNFNLNVGHRAYDLDDDILHGGYLGVDSRTTDRTTFYQLAAGYEQIRNDWEFRLNGYLPIGNQTSGGETIVNDSGLQTSTAFQGNQLALSTVGDRQLISQEEDALGGLDLEVGMQLDEWDSGTLRGFVGGYWLAGEESTLGIRGRLLADFESNFNAGLSVQHDGIFGTSVGFGVSVSLPGTRFHDDEEREFQTENEVAIRLRDPITRRPTVLVNERTEIETVEINETGPLRNPEEEEDYRFVHVALAGDAAGDGTFERPFSTVEDAIALVDSDAATFSDGNTIIYVDGEDALSETIPGFAVPDSVRVLSQGPAQTIAGMSFIGFPSSATRLPFSEEENFNVSSDAPNANGITVALPDSGDGVFPTITGGSNSDLVALGNNSVLSGFEIKDAAGNGVSATGVTNVEIRNNRIENSGGSGIALSNVGGNAILFDNEINDSAQRGIFVENTTADQDIEVAIAGFDLDNNGVGMAFSAVSTAGSAFPSQRVTIGPSSSANTSSGTPSGEALSNSILNSENEGLMVVATGNAIASSASQEVSVSDITIDNSGSTGIRLSATGGAHSQEMTIAASRITNSGSNGVEVINGQSSAPFATAAVQEFVLRDSVVDGNNGNGIDVSLAALGAQELVIRNNQITNNAGDGIRSIAQNFGTQEWRTDDMSGDAGISENTISGNGGQGINIQVADEATLPIISIVNNTLADNAEGPDIEILSTSLPANSAAVCVILDENIAPLGVQLTGPDPLLTGNAASILIQNLSILLADPNVTFITDEVTGGPTISSAAFTNEPNRCIP